MKTQLQIEQSPELVKAINEGFTIAFVFIEGFLHVIADPERIYPIKDVYKDPRPCIKSQTIVYRITTLDGYKGFAVLDWEEDP